MSVYRIALLRADRLQRRWSVLENNNEGSVKTPQIFVGVLCYRGLIYCAATNGQTREDC